MATEHKKKNWKKKRDKPKVAYQPFVYRNQSSPALCVGKNEQKRRANYQKTNNIKKRTLIDLDL
jgi:hypothetical protein